MSVRCRPIRFKEGKKVARILIVDDEKDITSILATLLQKNSYEVLVANNGRRAMELMDQERVDILITDMHMPEQSGLDTILEARHFFPGLKILALSGDVEILSKASYFGIDGVLSKPVAKDDLLTELRRLME